MKATVIGATGLIGSYLLELLLKDDHFDSLRVLVRRPFESDHPKLEKKLVDFTDAESFRLALEGSDVVFCSIGTTQKKVKGDKDAYYKIDFGIPVNLSRLCKMTGCEKFVLVSSVGANSKSNNFYLKLKGETDEAVKASGIKIIHIMRPSVLLGERNESRLGEKFGKAVLTAFSFLTPSKYKPIQGKDVAKAMLAVSKKNEEGYFVHENAEIKRISSGDL